MLQRINLPLTQESIKPYAKEITQWIESEEFLKEYKNKPFPPLLNPKQIDYDKISSSVAWELNLPLPQKFKFVYWGSHGAGNTGFGVFLAKYGGIAFYSTNNLNGKENYSSLYNQILNSKIPLHQFAYLALRNFPDDKDAQKFHHLIYANKAINLVRDPISTLKHYIGMKRYNNKSARHFSLHTNPNNIFPQLVGYTTINGGGGAENTSAMPSLESMEYYMDFRYKTFHDSQLINACHNIQNTLIIDMSEIIGQKAFNTMQKLAKYCDFKEISNTEKTFFEEKISQYEGVLPLTCHIPQINVNIFITTKYWLPINGIISYEVASRYEGIALPQDAKDITGQILDTPHNKISIAIKENEWAKLANCPSFSEIKAYINALIPHIEKQRQIEDSKAFNEQHLLDYLKNNPLLSNKFDNILEEHLAYIKQVRPDIVESWKYYAEFKQIVESHLCKIPPL